MWGAIIFTVAIVVCIYYVLQMRSQPETGIKLQYLGGYPGLKGPRNVNMENSGNCVYLDGVYLSKDKVADIKLVPRSVVGGALAGAALGAIVAGPVGALIGGGAAAGSPGINSVIQVTYSDNGINYELFFADADIVNKYPLVQRLLKS